MSTVQSTYKRYMNGFTNPRIAVLTGTPFMTVYDLKMKPRGVEEVIEEAYVIHEIIDGRTEQTFLWSHYYFTIDFSDVIMTPDGLKFRDIINYEQRAFDMIFYPEIGSPRSFIVMTVKDPITLAKLPFRNGHSGFTRTFKTKFPLTLHQRPGGTIWWLPVDGGTGTPVKDGHGHQFLGFDETNLIGDENNVFII